MPQERLREATNTCTAPLENRCSTAFLSMSLRPSWRYPTPLLSVSFRVYKLSTYFCKNFERTHTFFISIIKRHVWDYFNPIIYCLWLHSNPILFPCYNCIQIPNFIFKLRIQNSKNLTISKQPSNTPRQDIRPHMGDLYSKILRTAKRSTAYKGVGWIAVIKEQYGRQCLFKSVVQL